MKSLCPYFTEGCRRYATNSMGGRYKNVSPCTVPVVTPGDRNQSYQGKH